MATEVLTEIIKREPGNINAAARLNALKTISKAKTRNDEHGDPDILVDTLSGWLANIDRLSAHATGK